MYKYLTGVRRFYSFKGVLYGLRLAIIFTLIFNVLSPFAWGTSPSCEALFDEGLAHNEKDNKVLFEILTHSNVIHKSIDIYEKIQNMSSEELAIAEFSEFTDSMIWMRNASKKRLEALSQERGRILDFFKKQRRIKELNHIIDLLNASIERKGAKYSEMNLISLRFAISMSDVIEPREEARFGTLARQMMQLTPAIVLIPTHEPISIADFNRVSDKPIFFLGLVDKPSVADNILRTPFEFYIHDIAHSYQSLAHRYSKMFPGYNAYVQAKFSSQPNLRYSLDPRLLTKDSRLINRVLEQNQILHSKFEKLLSQHQSSIDRYVLEGLWFQAFHEFSPDVTAMDGATLAQYLRIHRDKLQQIFEKFGESRVNVLIAELQSISVGN